MGRQSISDQIIKTRYGKTSNQTYEVEVCEIIQDKEAEEIIEQPKYKSSASGIYAGPAVRKLAREFGIDLNKVIASGPRNRILKEDLHKFVKSKLKGSSTGIPNFSYVSIILGSTSSRLLGFSSSDFGAE